MKYTFATITSGDLCNIEGAITKLIAGFLHETPHEKILNKEIKIQAVEGSEALGFTIFPVENPSPFNMIGSVVNLIEGVPTRDIFYLVANRVHQLLSVYTAGRCGLKPVQLSSEKKKLRKTFTATIRPM